MKKTLLISSIACLILLAYAPLDTFLLREYHDHQRDYRSALAQAASTESERTIAENYPIHIRQLVLPELKRIDRCVSCHVGMEDPRMEDYPQPIGTHPGRYLEDHDVGKIGCTVCHDGQGRALTANDAHAEDIRGWEKPLLKPPFIEANCMRCHEVDKLPGLEMALQGRDILLASGCMGCHKIEGRGGQIAPELTHIGDASPRLKRAVPVDVNSAGLGLHADGNVAYIFESVKRPRAQPDVTAMMDFELSDDEARALTVYLKGLCKSGVPASYLAERVQARQPEDAHGKELYNKYCVACHGEDGRGGVENRNYAKGTIPALNSMAEKMFLEYEEDAEYVADLLSNGEDILNMSPPLDVDGRGRVLAQYRAISDVIKNGNPAGKADPGGPDPLLHMPSWISGFSRTDIDGIIAYLLMQYPWDDAETDE